MLGPWDPNSSSTYKRRQQQQQQQHDVCECWPDTDEKFMFGLHAC